MKSDSVTKVWEFYRDNCPGFKEPMRKELHKLDDYVASVEAENAKLREQMERLVTLLRVDCNIDASWDGLRRFWSIGLTESGCLMRDRACKAEAENAKLRELVREVYEDQCDECDRWKYRDRMRELGIEVDA